MKKKKNNIETAMMWQNRNIHTDKYYVAKKPNTIKMQNGNV